MPAISTTAALEIDGEIHAGDDDVKGGDDDDDEAAASLVDPRTGESITDEAGGDAASCNQALAAGRLTVEERQARADVLKAAIVGAGAG